MAKLYPSSISQIRNIPDSEKRLFDKFKTLDDSYHIFHSISWSDRSDGECDFIIFNEQKGFIALEVKGGKIDFDGKRWSSIDSAGKLYHIKDPVKQAQDTMRAVRRVYEEKYKASLPGIYTWGVCFFDCDRDNGFRTLDIHDANILDFHDSENIDKWAGNLFKVNEDYHGVKILSADEKEKIISLFNRELHIPLSLRRIILEQQRKLASADMMQEYMLDLFEDKCRIAFQGAAGTGKTWIAMKKALRLASAGKKVLYLCYNMPVCEFISSRLESYSSIHVDTFHSFANSFIREYITAELKRNACESDYFSCINDLLIKDGSERVPGGAEKISGRKPSEIKVQEALFSLVNLKYGSDFDSVLTEYESRLPIDIIDMIYLLLPDESGSDNFFDERMPLALSQAFENDHWVLEKFTFDAVIVDEAQDFHKNWCDSLKNLFEKYRNRTVYVFYDDNQTIYRRQKELPIRELISRSDHNNYIFRLRDNIRNTSDIHNYAVGKTGLGSAARPLDIPGIVPVEIEFSDESKGAEYTGNLLDELAIVNRIESGSIIVLSNRSIENSIFAGSGKAGNYTLATGDAGIEETSVRFRTINEFKGLESDVVILILHKRDREFEDKSRYLSEELFYVGFTRARHLLYVVNIV